MYSINTRLKKSIGWFSCAGLELIKTREGIFREMKVLVTQICCCCMGRCKVITDTMSVCTVYADTMSDHETT